MKSAINNKIITFCGMLLVICSTKAQNINPTEFVDFFPEKLKKISAKIHLAIVKKQIASYATDSLERKDLLRIKYHDTFSMSEYNFRNKSEIKSRKLKPGLDPNLIDLDDDSNYEDWTYPRYIDEDDFTPNISLAYKREIDKLGKITMTISAVGITTNKDYYIRDSVVKYQLVAGYVKFTDLNKILSVDDIKFLQLYSWYNSTGEPNGVYHGDNYEGVILTLNGNNKNNSSTSVKNRMGENLGKYISYSIKYKLFDLYRNKMFEIISGDTTVSFSEFEIPRSTMMNTLVLKPGVDPNLIDPEDPTNYIDTWFVIKPREFDFLGFEKRNNQIYFEIFDKNPVLSLSPGKTSEPKYIRTKYKIPFTAAIKYLHPTEIEAIQYLFK
jgi:hypothetical protein